MYARPLKILGKSNNLEIQHKMLPSYTQLPFEILVPRLCPQQYHGPHLGAIESYPTMPAYGKCQNTHQHNT